MDNPSLWEAGRLEKIQRGLAGGYVYTIGEDAIAICYGPDQDARFEFQCSAAQQKNSLLMARPAYKQYLEEVVRIRIILSGEADPLAARFA